MKVLSKQLAAYTFIICCARQGMGVFQKVRLLFGSSVPGRTAGDLPIFDKPRNCH
jgi:hypothetical protein